MLPMNNSQRPLPSSGSIILLCKFIKFSYNSTNSIVKFYFLNFLNFIFQTHSSKPKKPLLFRICFRLLTPVFKLKVKQ